jgi:Holliday junction DNA helicase, RuvA subunit
MFHQLYGTLLLLEASAAVIDCGGVGYKLTISSTTLASLPYPDEKTEKKVRLFTHLQVREDGIELFGFFSNEELHSFKLLTSVSGVGPKAAMAILSMLSPDKFALAVTSEDTKLLSRASGVGAKTAARIVLELKDKIAKEFPALASFDAPSQSGTSSAPLIGDRGKLTDAQDSLIVLGYTRAEAVNLLKGIDTTSMSTADIIKAALAKRIVK